jgi:hypothetical protein
MVSNGEAAGDFASFPSALGRIPSRTHLVGTGRADVIRQMYARDDTRDLAEVLMDLGTDDLLRARVDTRRRPTSRMLTP